MMAPLSISLSNLISSDQLEINAIFPTADEIPTQFRLSASIQQNEYLIMRSLA